MPPAKDITPPKKDTFLPPEKKDVTPPPSPTPTTPSMSEAVAGGAPEAGSSALGSAAPTMFGDLAGASAINVTRGAFKITENESPRPQDRVYVTYNYFNNVNGSLNPSGTLQLNVHREVVGFEKTFLDGDGSIGMRLPILQLDGGREQSDVGDLSIVFKYAFLNDCKTGDVLCGGMVVTVPTGSSFLPEGVPDIHPTVLQPFVGGIYNCDGFFVLGFSSIVVPLDSRDVVFWENDLGIGFSAYKDTSNDCLVSSIVPYFEAHVTTPLNHRGALTAPLGLPDILDLTAGARIGFGGHCSLGLAVAFPLTGPRPFDIEALAHLNVRF
jgi:hypothetical protein